MIKRIARNGSVLSASRVPAGGVADYSVHLSTHSMGQKDDQGREEIDAGRPVSDSAFQMRTAWQALA
jgi:hypothetical protein